MSESAIASLETGAASKSGVRVEFYKQGDRFSHTIFVVASEMSQPVLSSCEGSDSEMAPPSPPLADLHQQDEVLFLTGATTLAHWSMSVEIVGNRLVFDVASRWKEELPNLGSEYRVLDTDYRQALDFALEQEALQEVANNSLRITPSLPKPATSPATVQWRYSIASKA